MEAPKTFRFYVEAKAERDENGNYDVDLQQLFGPPENIIHYFTIDYGTSATIARILIDVFYDDFLQSRAGYLREPVGRLIEEIINNDPVLLKEIRNNIPYDSQNVRDLIKGIIRPGGADKVYASTLLPVRGIREDESRVLNIDGFAFSLPLDTKNAITCPVFTTWVGVRESFHYSLKVLDPNKHIVTSIDEDVEPTTPWGYFKHLAFPKFRTEVAGIYSVEVYADEILQLTRGLEFRSFEPRNYVTNHNPKLDICLISEKVSNFANEERIKIEGLLNNDGIKQGKELFVVLGFSECVTPFSIEYELLGNSMSPITETVRQEVPAPRVLPGLRSSLTRLLVRVLPPKVSTSTILWLRVRYSDEQEFFPFLIDARQ